MISSSIVSSSVILEQNTFIVDPIKTLENVNNESYTSEAIEFMRAINEEYKNQSKIFYKSLLESEDSFVVQESFSDFFSWVKKMIDKAIHFIKKIYDKFINFIMKLFKSDSYIKKNKSKISSFTGEFDIEGYKFTIDNNIPNTEQLNSIDTDFDVKGKSAAALKSQYENKKEKMDEILDKKRGQILNNKAGASIDETDFHDSCFEVYRNGDNSTETITITSSEALEAYRRFENYEKIVKEAKKECKEIIKHYTDLGKAYDTMVGKLNSAGTEYSDVHYVDSNGLKDSKSESIGKDIGLQLDLYAKLNSTLCQKLISAYNIAYTSKLDALKAQYNQDKAICYKAINKANSEK